MPIPGPSKTFKIGFKAPEEGYEAYYAELIYEVDGKPFRALHRDALDAYLAALFAQLDSDNDGVFDLHGFIPLYDEHHIS